MHKADTQSESRDDQAILSQLHTLRFRVLVEYSSENSYYLARCLETNSTATADVLSELEDLIKELLEEEITYAAAHNTLEDLFSKQAPPDVWMRWMKVARTRQPKTINLQVSFSKASNCKKVGVPTEFALPEAA